SYVHHQYFRGCQLLSRKPHQRWPQCRGNTACREGASQRAPLSLRLASRRTYGRSRSQILSAMALEAIEQKKELIESRARIREFVFGIQDGLMSTLGLLTGVQGATESTAAFLLYA